VAPTLYRNEEAVMNVLAVAHPLAVLAKSSGITLDPIAKPIAAVLAFFYSLIPTFGAAIILLTVAVMVILTPLTIKQTRSMLVMQKLQPELKRLQAEHKNDRQALNEAMMALYKEHNASPLGGCLPMLLPFPVFFALFRVLEGLARKGPKGVGWDPKYLTHSTQMYKDIVAQHGTLKAFGVDLAKSATNVTGSFVHALPYIVLLLIMVGTQFYQQRQLTSRNPQANQGQQAQIMKFFPLIFGVISVRFPAGVVLYWTLSNMIRIFQQWAMYRWDPKVKALVAQDVKEVEAKTREIESKPPAARPRLRDLLSGQAPPPKANDPKAGGRPPAGRAGSGKPAARKPAGPVGGRPAGPAGGKAAGPTSNKGVSQSGGKPSPNGAGKGRAGTPPRAKASPNGGVEDASAVTSPTPDEAPLGPGQGTGRSDAEPANPPARPAPNPGASGAPRGRTGGGSATGNRNKQPRRGR
jgi:YidC/Oxa1 family membrane protein insertase